MTKILKKLANDYTYTYTQKIQKNVKKEGII